MSTREKILVGIALLFAALFVRLGFWQLERLGERRRHNEKIAARMFLPPKPIRDIGEIRQAEYERVYVHGEYDYQRELVLTMRSRDGSPGVHLLTPLRVPGSDTAIIVNRGWIYAPDGVTADTRPWREANPGGPSIGGRLSAAIGYLRVLPTGDSASARTTGRPDGLRRLDLATIREMLPYPVAPYYVALDRPRQVRDGVPPGVPPRVPQPSLSEGSHLSYAMQWFTFAVIAVGGVGILVLRLRSRDADGESKYGV